MTSLRVLVLGSYPASNPRHGGQVRLSQILAAYRRAGMEVRQASFFPAHDFYTRSGGLGAADVPLPVPQLHTWDGRPSIFAEDIAAGDLAATDERIAALEKQAGPIDVLHLEQPWLLPVVEKLRERGRIGAFRLVYGSQNIEHLLKGAMLRQQNASEAESLTQAVLALERRCAEQASLVVAVTPDDAQVLAGWTAVPVLIAGNGIEPWRSTSHARERWRRRFGGEPFALYVASAHPPNIQGFGDCFGPSLAALAPDQKVVLAGHAAEFVLRSDWFRHWQPLNRSRSMGIGVLALEDLSAVRDLAHTFVLPVTSGGGSNLKAAEALYSGRHVVATRLAMRGFEAYEQLPGLHLAQPGAEFAHAVSRSLREPLPGVNEEAARARDSLTWAQTLAPLVRAVGDWTQR
jgi:glycosyltransferase involved in cell wall biosynthesis